MRILRQGWIGLAWLGLGGMVLAAEPSHQVVLEASKAQATELVMQGNGKMSELPSEGEPEQMKGCVSEVVEKFLRRAIRDYEEMKNPPKYSALIYIVPGDDLGEMGKSGQVKTVRPEDLPSATQHSMGGE